MFDLKSKVPSLFLQEDEARHQATLEKHLPAISNAIARVMNAAPSFLQQAIVERLRCDDIGDATEEIGSLLLAQCLRDVAGLRRAD